MKLETELIEVGNLEPIETASQRGVVLKRQNGELIAVFGLTESECRELGKLLYEGVTVLFMELAT